MIQIVLACLLSGLQLVIEEVLFTCVDILLYLLKMLYLARVVRLPKILKGLQGGDLKVKTKHVAVVW